MDTLPSGNRQRWLQVRLGCVRLSLSCPFRLLHTFLSPGPRGITPAFGYGAPHSSARGTSTLPINALLSAHYAAVRLPATVREGLIAHRVLPPARRSAAGGNGVSRFSRMKFLCMPGAFVSAGPSARSRIPRAAVLPSESPTSLASWITHFGAQYPAYRYPCPTLQVRRCRRPHMARGQSGSLLLLCTTLSFATSCRFIPALSGPGGVRPTGVVGAVARSLRPG